jgi:multiple sugar transport system substrate-binding protein
MSSEPKKVDRRKFIYAGLGAVALIAIGAAAYVAMNPPVVTQTVTTSTTVPTTSVVTTTSVATTTVTGTPTTVPQKEVTIEWWDGQSGADGDVIQMLIDEFNEEYKGRIKVVRTMQGAWGDVFAKLTAAYKAGKGMPDGLMMHFTEVPLFADTAVKPVDDYVKGPDGLDPSDFNPVGWNASFYKGKQYAIPWDIHPMGFYVNINVFKKYDIPIPDALNSVDDVLALWRTIKQKGKGEVWPTTLETQTIDFFWPIYTLAEATTFLTPDNKAPDIRKPQWLKAFQILRTVGDEKLAPPSAGRSDQITLFGRGDSATMIFGPWMILEWARIPGLVYDVIPMNWNVWASSHMMFMTRANGKERDDATWTFIKWMHKPANIGRYGQYSGMPPATFSGANYPPYKINPINAKFAEQQKKSAFTPAVPQIWEIVDKINFYCQKLVRSEITAEQALDAVESEIKRILAS